MAQWYVKKLSKLTGVGTKTLYHYESIGLLRPSMRLDNGYRVYTEADLIKLQQILALKSFGFGLAQIKAILSNNVGVTEQLLLQSRFLKEKAQSLIDASATLDNVVASLGGSTTVAWETVIQLIEVYKMTNELKKSWVGEAMNELQLKEYTEFTQELKSRFTDEDRIAGEAKWADIANRIRNNLDKDPSSDFGIAIGKECMDMVNLFYGKKHFELRKVIWEEGYRKGKIDPKHQWAEPAVVEWSNQAKQAYYHSVLIGIVNQATACPLADVKVQWGDIIAEMCAQDRQVAIAKSLLSDSRLNAAGKRCLEGLIATA
ncbi:MAG: hypothetical protein QG604_646 [Candidatus Dependentiae bacterium]|nr:hypothetical protein [Candidatus Dependentiae bacterium]